MPLSELIAQWRERQQYAETKQHKRDDVDAQERNASVSPPPIENCPYGEPEKNGHRGFARESSGWFVKDKQVFRKWGFVRRNREECNGKRSNAR